MQNSIENNKSDIEELAHFLDILSEPNRLRIICFLQKNGKQCVCKIWTFLKLPQNLISHHLKILKDANLLNAKKNGLNIYYEVNQKELSKYKSLLEKILKKEI